MRALRETLDSRGREDHHLADLGLYEIPLPAIDENEIARRDRTLPKRFALPDDAPGQIAASVCRQLDRLRGNADAYGRKAVPQVGTADRSRRRSLVVHNAFAGPGPLENRQRERIPGRLFHTGCRVIPPERLLHRTCRDLERLVEISTKGHRDRNRDDQRVEPLLPVILKRFLQPAPSPSTYTQLRCGSWELPW